MPKEVLTDVLIVGSGGREHALGWKLNQSGQVGRKFFARGNAGTEKLGTNISRRVRYKSRWTLWWQRRGSPKVS